MKLTKRKGFNFYRSYYDVFNELNDSDKLIFIKALLDKQFLGKEPDELEGMCKFAWISQSHNIDCQVKGWETKTKTKLPLSAPPCVGVEIPPTRQEKEEEKEEEKEVLKLYNKFVDEVKNHNFDSQVESLYMRLKIKQTSLTPLLKDFQCNVIENLKNPEFIMHKNTNQYFTNFKNWLNVQDRIGKLDKYKI